MKRRLYLHPRRGGHPRIFLILEQEPSQPTGLQMVPAEPEFKCLRFAATANDDSVRLQVLVDSYVVA